MALLKKIFRTTVLALFIIVAAAFGGIAGAVALPRENYQNNEMRIEMVDRKRLGESKKETQDYKQRE